MTTVIEAPALTLRERALAAVAAEDRAWQEQQDKEAAERRERELNELRAARLPIGQKFGIDLNWTDAVGTAGLDVDGLILKPTLGNNTNGWGFEVYRRCASCGGLDLGWNAWTLLDLGYRYQSFEPMVAHNCPPVASEDDDADLPFTERGPVGRSDDAFFDFVIDGLRRRGVVLDGGTC